MFKQQQPSFSQPPSASIYLLFPLTFLSFLSIFPLIVLYPSFCLFLTLHPALSPPLFLLLRKQNNNYLPHMHRNHGRNVAEGGRTHTNTHSLSRSGMRRGLNVKGVVRCVFLICLSFPVAAQSSGTFKSKTLNHSSNFILMRLL